MVWDEGVGWWAHSSRWGCEEWAQIVMVAGIWLGVWVGEVCRGPSTASGILRRTSLRMTYFLRKLEVVSVAALGVVAAGASPDRDGDDEVEEEPELDAAVEIDEIHDQGAGQDDPGDGREQAVEVEGAESVAQPHEADGDARKEESEDQEPEREIVMHGHLREDLTPIWTDLKGDFKSGRIEGQGRNTEILRCAQNDLRSAGRLLVALLCWSR